MRKEDTLYRINKMNSRDPMVQDVVEAITLEMNEIDRENQQIRDDMYFDTCSIPQLQFYEGKCKIAPPKDQAIEDRRSSVEARWKSEGKVNVELLQAVADSWKYGKVDVEFVGNKIQITFVDTLGVPKDTAGLEAALDEVKPAHLPIIFLVIYLFVRDVNSMTVNELQSHLIGDFAF